MVATTHRATQENGPNVVNGRLVWTSATGITKADPNSFGGCARRYYYEEVEGKKPPETKAQRGGTNLHSEIEHRLRTGASLQSPLALAGGIFVPHPGSGLHVEHPIHFVASNGVHIFGHVDLYNLRQEYIDPYGNRQQDPPWSFEVKDWKTTSDFQYAKTERELAENIQLNTYAEAGFRLWPDFEHSRFTHVYFRTRGVPDSKLVTILRSRDEVAARWAYAESVIRTMSDVVQAPTAAHVPGNRKSCSAYSGCPHREYCDEYRRTSLDNLYNKVANDFVNERTPPVGLLSNNPQIMQNAPQAQTAPQTDMRAQLAAEEAQMRQQVAQQQQQMPQQLNTAQLADACQRLSAFGFGFPSLGGNAAQAYALLGGQQIPPGFIYQGIPAPAGARRSLHALPLNEVAHIYQLLQELEAERGTQGHAIPQYTPVTNPPAHGAQGVVQMTQQAITQMPQAAVPSNNGNFGGILPPGAPESIPQLAMQQPTQAPQPQSPEQIVQHGEAPADPPKKKAGRPKKTLDAAPEAATTPSVAQTAATTPSPTPSTPVLAAATQVPPAAESASEGPRINLEWTAAILVNARLEGVQTKSLAGYVDYVNEKLAKMYNRTKSGEQGPLDVRAAVDGSILGYGGWKGCVREVVKADPPPPDAYHFDTFMSELNEVVADALRVVAEQKGWLYVRGVRG